MLHLGIEPGYVLDRMETYEMRALMKHSSLMHRESWEQTRMLGFINARCAGSKIDKPEALFSLPWDNGGKQTKTTAEDVENMKELSNRWIEQGLIG